MSLRRAGDQKLAQKTAYRSSGGADLEIPGGADLEIPGGAEHLVLAGKKVGFEVDTPGHQAMKK